MSTSNFFERPEPAGGTPPPLPNDGEIGRAMPTFRSAGLYDEKGGWNVPWDQEPGEKVASEAPAPAERRPEPERTAIPERDQPDTDTYEPEPRRAGPPPASSTEVERLSRIEQSVERLSQLADGGGLQRHVAEAIEGYARRQQGTEEWRRRTAPPTLPTVEEIIERPELIHTALNNVIEWQKNMTESYAAPISQQAQVVGEILEPIVEMASDNAWQLARAQAIRDGFSADEFSQLAPLANRIMVENRTWSEATRARCSPRNVYYAFRMAHTHSGRPAPVRANTGAPPGVPGRSTNPTAGARLTKPADVLDVERRLGIKFDDAMTRTYLRELETLR